MKMNTKIALATLLLGVAINANADTGEIIKGKTLVKSEAWTKATQNMADAHGLSFAEVEAARIFHEKFRDYVLELKARFPEKIAATWVDRIPSVGGHIRLPA